MSVYGDSTSIRNGRTSSEISIYDYPEHLNPFYEDENHKRIRFWKIGKNKKSNSNSNVPSRRNSFSFGGLKDMWAFKSFRPKKSSTLGINKTSESPPRLQTVDIRDTNYGTLDNRSSRYSTGLHNGNNQQFQRNVPYRSSLQDMRYSGNSVVGGYNNNDVNLRNNNGFGRNEMYRATIQTPSRMNRTNNMMMRNSTNQRYQVTSSPKLQSSDRRSSQLSVASSTNPFEDDDDDIDDNDKENLNTTWHGDLNKEKSDKIRPATSANSLTRPYRKKRRAPPPPVPIPNVIEEEPNKKDGNEISPTHTNKNGIESTNQETSQEHVITNEEKEISNLTAEIESFVNQTVKEDSPEQNIPPVPPERKYFREDISIKTQKNKNESPPPTPKIVITEEKQEIKTTKKPSVTIISEPTQVIEHTEVIILEDEKDAISNEPQKVIVQTTIVEKGGSRTITVSNTNSSNEKILNTDTKPIPSARKINEVHNEAIINNDINITNNIITPPTSPKKEKPPISPKPNLTDIQNKNNELEQEQQMGDNENINKLNSTNSIDKQKLSESETANNNLTSEICKYNHIPINQCELKITESSEDISAEIANEIVTLPYVPLKSESPINNESVITTIKNGNKSASQNDINENVELRETKLDNNLINNIRPRSHFTDEEPEHRRPVKYERKKSVREIIESINKNQSLLKVNNMKSSTNGANGRESNKDFEIKANNLGESELKDLDESQRDFKKLLYELENYECNNNKNQKNLSEINNNNNHVGEIDLIFNKIDQLNDNENIFKKCSATHHINGNSIITTTTTTVTTSSKSSREASPTASNLDWNPVPKPKRTKKLNNDLIMTTSSSPDSCNERLIE
ncbi:probable serine/threonine-protein kinase DDB_G0282963 isoform X2 [Condylostylus longicornis]|uniref:probable serine/threonine-protein kinase DDB_G0282963 isoform X2 n=1 Tax=Condylostylus longicornis TaxID=2530218 RepID=UPI00244DFC5E|nr:probable serine/threonine-protein kinase DDB_G0282963 isoform X2 [Condylostylus longicornis]